MNNLLDSSTQYPGKNSPKYINITLQGHNYTSPIWNSRRVLILQKQPLRGWSDVLFKVKFYRGTTLLVKVLPLEDLMGRQGNRIKMVCVKGEIRIVKTVISLKIIVHFLPYKRLQHISTH